jgi:hypothetical protein
MRRILIGVPLTVVVLIAVAVVVTSTHFWVKHPLPPATRTVNLSDVQRVPAAPSRYTTARQVPVLVYHEMDNGCVATAVLCTANDIESVSRTQFATEMAWMYAHGYHTVTLGQYLDWLHSGSTRLPHKPFLITVDNGIGNFLTGAQSILYHYRYTAVADLITGFANGAAGHCAQLYPATGELTHGINIQPGCPRLNYNWDLSWAQIKALSPQVYSFQMEAGTAGHYVQDYSKTCTAYDVCMMPRESAAHYEARVRTEISNGIRTLKAELGKRYSPRAWVVPYSDLGYPCHPNPGCAEGSSHNFDAPRDWLVNYAQSQFQAVFVQDYYRNNIKHERFRYEIHATYTLHQFVKSVRHYLHTGAWAR